MNLHPLLRVFFPALSCVMAVQTGISAAQETGDQIIELDAIVVTATKNVRFVQDAPASVTVISGEELRKKPVHDLADAVEGSPGVQISGVGLGRRGIAIRGMETDDSLVLIDGMRVSNSSSAVSHSDFELGWVPVEAIERIEVVRGPMSSLYGSEALGGVINIITRSATEEWHGSLSTQSVLTEDRRGGDGYRLNGYIGGPIIPGLLGLNVWGGVNGRTELASEYDRRLSSSNDEKAFIGNATLTWTPDDRQRIDLSYGAGFEARWRNTESRSSGYYRSDDDIWRQHVSLSHEGKWGWGTSRVRVYRTSLDRENARTDGSTASGPHRFDDTVGDGQISFAPFTGHMLTLGGEVRLEQLEDPTVNGSGEADQLHYATFVQDEIEIGESWEVVLGGRFDHHEDYGWHASPRAYLLHHFNEALTFKAGVGAGFKAPTLKRLSPDYSASAAGGRFTIVGNPDLEPETNISYEAGFEFQRGIWSARAMGFHNDLDNLIETVCILNCAAARGSTRTYQNIEKARIQGVELGVGVELIQDLRLDVNYTYLDTEDETTGKPLTGRSRHSANSTLKWSALEDLTTSLEINYVGSQRTDTGTGKQEAYTLLSAYADYALTDHTTLKFGVENITDEGLDDENSDYPLSDGGRRYFVGLTARF